MLTYTRYNQAAAITPSNTVNFPLGLSDAIYVGGAGIVAVIFQDGNEVDLTCVAGQVLPVQAIRVNSTNTTATLLAALYVR